MKKYISYVLSVLLIASLVLTSTVTYTGNTVIAEAATIKISSKVTTLEVGKTTSLTISGTTKKPTWSSSNKKIATITSSGKVTAIAGGKVTITAYVAGKKVTYPITVKYPVKINHSSATLEIGNTIPLIISGTAKRPVWSTSNKNVATVSSTGKVTAKATGSATITAAVDGKKITSQITVIKMSAASATLEVGLTKLLTVYGTTKTPTWYSNNKAVATVSSSGKVTAIATGKAIITASINGKKITSQITVIEPAKISNTQVTLNVGKKDLLSVTGTITGISMTPIWTSSNNAVATISSDGTVTAVATGSAILTARINGKELTSMVTVTEPISISESAITLEAGQSQALQINGITYRAIWSTSNRNIALVSIDGKVTGVSEGTATITATVDGEKFTFNVTVTRPANYMGITIITSVGDNATQLFLPIQTSDPVLWESRNEELATVSDQGILSAKKEGSVVVSATVNGSIYTYLIIIEDNTNPYTQKASFAAKEISFNNLNYIIPTAWSSSTDSFEAQQITVLSPDKVSGSNVIIDIQKTDLDAPDYYTAKQSSIKTLNQVSIRKTVDSLFSGSGNTYSISNFKQSDYVADLGNVLKTEYTLVLNGVSSNQVYYSFYLDKYMVNIIVTDNGTANLQETVQYVLNSFVVR